MYPRSEEEEDPSRKRGRSPVLPAAEEEVHINGAAAKRSKTDSALAEEEEGKKSPVPGPRALDPPYCESCEQHHFTRESCYCKLCHEQHSEDDDCFCGMCGSFHLKGRDACICILCERLHTPANVCVRCDHVHAPYESRCVCYLCGSCVRADADFSAHDCTLGDVADEPDLFSSDDDDAKENDASSARPLSSSSSDEDEVEVVVGGSGPDSSSLDDEEYTSSEEEEEDDDENDIPSCPTTLPDEGEGETMRGTPIGAPAGTQKKDSGDGPDRRSPL